MYEVSGYSIGFYSSEERMLRGKRTFWFQFQPRQRKGSVLPYFHSV